MKLVQMFGIGMIVLLLSGCFEVNEQIDIKPDGSGMLDVKTDMSGLVELMQNYAGKGEMENQMPKHPIDTTISMNSLPDGASGMSPETKLLLKNGTVHIQLNMDEKIFKSDLMLPFKSMANLQVLYKSMNDQSMGMASMFKNMAGKKDSLSTQAPESMPETGQFNGIYDFQSRDGLLSRKLNADKWKTLQQSQQFSQMKDAGNMGISIPYTITINLPRPVKKVDNTLAVISPDKKQVVIKYNLIEVFQHPEQFGYTIVY